MAGSKCLISSWLSVNRWGGGACRPSARISSRTISLFSIMVRGCPGSLPSRGGGCPRHYHRAILPSAKKQPLRGVERHLECGKDMMTLLFYCHQDQPNIFGAFSTTEMKNTVILTFKSDYNWRIHDCGRWRYELIWRSLTGEERPETRFGQDCHLDNLCPSWAPTCC